MPLKSLDGIILVLLFQFGFFDCLMERLDGAIIGRSIYREWRAVLTTVVKLNLAGSLQTQGLFCLPSPISRRAVSSCRLGIDSSGVRAVFLSAKLSRLS